MDVETNALLKRHYQFAEWAGQRTTSFSLFIHGLFVPSNVLSEWQAVRVRRVVKPAKPIYTRTAWAANDGVGTPSLVTEIYECDSALAAHETLLALTAGFQVPVLRLGTDAEALGDIWFQAADGSTILFARANIVVVVSPLLPIGLAVIRSAELIDMFIKDRPAAAASSAAEHSLLAALPDTQTLKAPLGERTALGISDIKTDPASNAICVKLFYDKGQVFREAREVVFNPEVTGDAHIDMYELTPDGAVHNRTVKVQVE